QGRALAREVNDEIATMTRQWPTRFAGLATLPVQDVKAAIDELERAVTVLGLKGAELDTIVNGENWDDPRFLPLFKAAEAMRAVPSPGRRAATSAGSTTTPWSAARRRCASCSTRSASIVSCSAVTGRSCPGIPRRWPGCRA